MPARCQGDRPVPRREQVIDQGLCHLRAFLPEAPRQGLAGEAPARDKLKDKVPH